jgi:ribose transport system permease protein
MAFAILLPGFFSAHNLVILGRNSAVLGILGVALAIVVIGGGIDLSLVAIMAVGAAWAVKLTGAGVSEWLALGAGLLACVGMGAANGLLVAFIEVPPIFTTLATAMLIYGIGQFVLIHSTIVYVPQTAVKILWLGQYRFLGLPLQIMLMAGIMILGHMFLKYSRWGRFTYAQGDNLDSARLTGIGTRPMVIAQYVIAAVIAYLAGLMLAGANPAFSLRVADAGMLFDVVLVVVLGGVSLSGGSGAVSSVFAGTLLIGTLLNGMTIMNLPQQWQDLAKGVVLLLAIILDTILHPRDEETARQSDI